MASKNIPSGFVVPDWSLKANHSPGHSSTLTPSRFMPWFEMGYAVLCIEREFNILQNHQLLESEIEYQAVA